MRTLCAYLLGALTAGVGGAAALSLAPDHAAELDRLRAENLRLRVAADVARRERIAAPAADPADRIPPTALPTR